MEGTTYLPDNSTVYYTNYNPNPIPQKNENTDNHHLLYIIIAVVVIIFVGILIWWWLSNEINKDPDPNKTPNLGNHGSICSSTNQCKSHLVCQSSVCLVPIGGSCNSLTECVSNAADCQNGLCSVNNKSILNQDCNITEDCHNGFECENNLCKSKAGSLCKTSSDCTTPNSGCQDGVCIAPPSKLNESCTSDSSEKPCQDGLTCDSESGNICKVINQGSCRTNNECSSDLTCRDSVCRIVSPDDQICISNSDCNSNSCGSSQLLSQDRRGQLHLIHEFKDAAILDVISEGDNLLILLDDGNILREVGSNNHSGLEMIKNNININRLASLGGLGTGEAGQLILYGLSNYILYELDPNQSTSNDWIWIPVRWAPKIVTHISHSQDGNFLWIQFPIHISPPKMPQSAQNMYSKPRLSGNKTVSQQGTLYQFQGSDIPPLLIQRTVLSKNTLRNLGLDNIRYMEVDTQAKQATRFPKGDLIDDFHVGIILRDASIFKIGGDQEFQVREVRLIDDIPHIITHRNCDNQGSYNKSVSRKSKTWRAYQGIELDYLLP